MKKTYIFSFKSYFISKKSEYYTKNYKIALLVTNNCQTFPDDDQEIRIGHWYYLSKWFDWFDTFFYVLRKKYSHISFLHLYHHISVPTFAYLILKINPLIPGAFLFIVINAFIHCVMYSYYALSALGPKIQKVLWWKRYVTVMQLTQFVICIIYGCILFCKQSGYPTVWLILGVSQPPLFFIMFHNFYRKAYNTINNNNNIDLNFNSEKFRANKTE